MIGYDGNTDTADLILQGELPDIDIPNNVRDLLKEIKQVRPQLSDDMPFKNTFKATQSGREKQQRHRQDNTWA